MSVTPVPISDELLDRLRKVVEDDTVKPIVSLSNQALVETAIEMQLAEMEW